MKRCPECRRDCYDDSLLYCLDDGSALRVANSHPEALYTGIINADEKNKWIGKLERQAAFGNFWLFLIKTEPRFDPLRGGPPFRSSYEKV